jgi:CubicO group peptidase (beta-lactamase class C family)
MMQSIKNVYPLNFEKSASNSSARFFKSFNLEILKNFPACKHMLTTYRGQLVHELINPNPRIDDRMPLVNGFYALMIPFIPHWKDTMLNNRGAKWNGRSVAKCVLSALIGIALHKGLISSLSESLGESLPNVPEDKQKITLEQLITMTSGMPFTDKIPEMPRWLRSKNWVEYLLSLPLICQPGEKFAYSTGNSHLLAAVLNYALNGNLRQFAQKELFNPLGIGDVYWEIDPQGIPFGGANLFLSIQEMLKIGYLYLQNGFWDGQQLLPQQWVVESMSAKVHAKDHFDYGYAWWIRDFDLDNSLQPIRVVCACGWAGQRIYIIPEMESVIAIISKADLWANTENLDSTFGRTMLPALKDYIQCMN